MSQDKNDDLNLGPLSSNSDKYIRLSQEILRISRLIAEVSASADLDQLSSLRRQLDMASEQFRQHHCAARAFNAEQLGMTMEEYERWLEETEDDDQPDDEESDPVK